MMKIISKKLNYLNLNLVTEISLDEILMASFITSI